MSDEERLLLRIPEAAQRLGLGRSTVYQLIAAGHLPIIRIGRAVRIPVAGLTHWVENQSTEMDLGNDKMV
jgi:excisionase family DNA binding protein